MYRKFSADHIFNGYTFLQQQVLITDSSGIVVDLVEEREAGDDIDKRNGILCPGFINTHCHLELSHMKGLVPKGSGLVDFVLKVVHERHFDEAEIFAAIEAAEEEMLKNGIVAVGDICNNTLTIPQKTKGRLRYHNFIEASGFPASVAEKRFKRAADLYTGYAGKFSASSIVPHAPYSVSPELFGLINEFPGNDLLTIHNQETAAENEFFEKGTGDFLRLYEQMGIDISAFQPSGRSSLQTWLPNFSKSQTMILVHNVSTSEEDLLFIKPATDQSAGQAGNGPPLTFFCLCPNANLYINNALPNVKMLMRDTDHIVLGTDSLASNDQLSILEEIKTLQNNCKELNLETLLQWATSNGSRALQLDRSLGSFEKGKQPGLVLIEGIDHLRTTDHSAVQRIL